MQITHLFLLYIQQFTDFQGLPTISVIVFSKIEGVNSILQLTTVKIATRTTIFLNRIAVEPATERGIIVRRGDAAEQPYK